jgi:hypothetical protein
VPLSVIAKAQVAHEDILHCPNFRSLIIAA